MENALYGRGVLMDCDNDGVKQIQKVQYDLLSRTLIELGLLPSKKGFYYLRYAIGNYVNKVSSITTIYKSAGAYFAVSPVSIERCIRTGITDAQKSGAIYRINELFGCKVFHTGHTPTNSELITVVAEYIKQCRV